MTYELRRPLRLGVIGTGGIAQSSHLPALARLRRDGWDVSVTAVADPNTERRRATSSRLGPLLPSNQTSCRTYSQGVDLLVAGGIDAALILTPPTETSALLEHALTLEIPILAEKPAAPNAVTLSRLVQLEKTATNPLIRIAYNRRSLPLVPAFLANLKQMWERSSAGILHTEARLWRVQRNDAIFYEDTMVHALDFLRWSLEPLAGPLVVRRVDWWASSTAGKLPSGLHVVLSTEGHALTAHLDVRPAVGWEQETYEVLGEKQALKLAYPPAGTVTNIAPPSELFFYENGERRSAPRPVPDSPEDDPAGLWERGFLPQLVDFLDLVSGNVNAGNRLCTLTQAQETALLKEQILSS